MPPTVVQVVASEVEVTLRSVAEAASQEAAQVVVSDKEILHHNDDIRHENVVNATFLHNYLAVSEKHRIFASE